MSLLRPFIDRCAQGFTVRYESSEWVVHATIEGAILDFEVSEVCRLHSIILFFAIYLSLIYLHSFTIVFLRLYETSLL